MTTITIEKTDITTEGTAHILNVFIKMLCNQYFEADFWICKHYCKTVKA